MLGSRIFNPLPIEGPRHGEASRVHFGWGGQPPALPVLRPAKDTVAFDREERNRFAVALVAVAA